MKEFDFISYKGNESFVYLGCRTYDQSRCFDIVKKLESKKFRLYYKDKEESASDVAEAINNCELAIFFISKQSLDELSFRNEINYALNIKKKVVYFNIDNAKLTHGLGMQLQTVEEIKLDGNSINNLLDKQYLNQDMIGEQLDKKDNDYLKKKLFVLVLAISILFAFVGTYFIVKNRIEYYKSPEYIYRDVDGIEYLKIEKNVDKSLISLNGKTIERLDISSSDVTNLLSIENISIKELDISNNPNLTALWPILRCDGLEVITISQDQVDFTKDLLNCEINIYVVGGNK